jgi:hypothetical protein
MEMHERVALYDACRDTATHVRGILLAKRRAATAEGDIAAADDLMDQVRALNADVDAIDSNNREQMVSALDHWKAIIERDRVVRASA